MSLVTNVILTISCTDDEIDGDVPPGLTYLKRWCQDRSADNNRPGWSRSCDDVSGGSKHLEVGMYCWGANYLDIPGFVAAVASAPWEYPESVQVFIQCQDEVRFRMLSLDAETRKWIVHGDDPGIFGYPWEAYEEELP